MDSRIRRASQEAGFEIERPAAAIAAMQRPDGDIPWSPGMKTDPWDLVEAAMGLAVAGRVDLARKAYRWLAARQLADGSWYSAYLEGVPLDRTREAHFAAYLAVGLYQDFLLTSDRGFLAEMWPTTAAGIEFALSLQAPTGEIWWAISPEGRIDPMALLTASSSVFFSLRCALAVGGLLGESRPGWVPALRRLGEAIRFRPRLFNFAKARYSMDWFYPVLAGVRTGADAERRIARGWRKFVVEGLGVRCVADRPWITIAETSELALALAAMGRLDRARVVFGWIAERRFADGSYVAGFTFPDMTIWPTEAFSWTNAGVLLAADALFGLTAASGLFHHRPWAWGG